MSRHLEVPPGSQFLSVRSPSAFWQPLAFIVDAHSPSNASRDLAPDAVHLQPPTPVLVRQSPVSARQYLPMISAARSPAKVRSPATPRPPAGQHAPPALASQHLHHDSSITLGFLFQDARGPLGFRSLVRGFDCWCGCSGRLATPVPRALRVFLPPPS